jgi:hypothetical protein
MTQIHSGADLMDAVRDAMDGEPVGTLSKRISVSASALYAIRRGKTKWPRDYTLFALTLDLGLEVRVTRRKR